MDMLLYPRLLPINNPINIAISTGCLDRTDRGTHFHLSTLEYRNIQLSYHDAGLSILLALCAGNPTSTGGFPTRRPVMQIFAVFFAVRLEKLLN